MKRIHTEQGALPDKLRAAQRALSEDLNLLSQSKAG